MYAISIELRWWGNNLLPISKGIHKVHVRFPAINVSHFDFGRRPKEDEAVIGRLRHNSAKQPILPKANKSLWGARWLFPRAPHSLHLRAGVYYLVFFLFSHFFHQFVLFPTCFFLFRTLFFHPCALFTTCFSLFQSLFSTRVFYSQPVSLFQSFFSTRVFYSQQIFLVSVTFSTRVFYSQHFSF